GAEHPAIHARRPATLPANGLSHDHARFGLRELTGMPDFFRSFLPLENPLGFGAGDYLELVLAAMLLAALVCWKRIAPYALRLAEHTVWAMAVLAALPVVLRLALLAHHPVPAPDVYDEFSHLLVA